MVRNELNVVLVPNFSNEDIATARIEDSAGELWFISTYMPHDDEVESLPELLSRALSKARQWKPT